MSSNLCNFVIIIIMYYLEKKIVIMHTVTNEFAFFPKYFTCQCPLKTIAKSLMLYKT